MAYFMSHSTLSSLKTALREQLTLFQKQQNDRTSPIGRFYMNNQKKFLQYVRELEQLFNQEDEDIFTKVFIGATVKIVYLEEEDEETYTICFPEEADPDQGKISFLSPIGNQLLLEMRGNSIDLDIPGGKTAVKISEIHY